MKYRIIALLVFFLLCEAGQAQSYLKEKRIYLLDVTASMVGEGVVETPNIFNDVKEQLKNTLDNVESTHTEIVVVPFTDVVHNPINGWGQKGSYHRHRLVPDLPELDLERCILMCSTTPCIEFVSSIHLLFFTKSNLYLLCISSR